jgi:hypothetical protein
VTRCGCSALTSAAALAIALALRSSARERPRAVRAAASRPKPVRSALRPSPRRHWGALTAAGHADSSTLPSPGAGLQLGSAAGVVRFQAGLGAGHLGPVSELRDGRGGRFWLAGGQFDACLLLIARRPATLAACALLEAGRLKSTGKGIDHPRDGSALWIAPGGRLMTSLRLGRSRFSVLFGVSTLHAAVRRPFVLNGHEQVHRPAAVAGRMKLGIVGRLW